MTTENKALESILEKLKNSVDFLEQSNANMNSLHPLERIEITGNEAQAILDALSSNPQKVEIDWDSVKTWFYDKYQDDDGWVCEKNAAILFHDFKDRIDQQQTQPKGGMG